jgi:hypothetical protein
MHPNSSQRPYAALSGKKLSYLQAREGEETTIKVRWSHSSSSMGQSGSNRCKRADRLVQTLAELQQRWFRSTAEATCARSTAAEGVLPQIHWQRQRAGPAAPVRRHRRRRHRTA